MNQSCVLFAICIAVSGINGRPQVTLPSVNTPIIPIGPHPVYLRPSGQIIYLSDSLPMNFNAPNPSMPLPMSMLLAMPGPPRGPLLPLALFPYFNNQLNPAMISNGLYKQRASTATTSIMSVSENKITGSTAVYTEVATGSPTASTQSIVNLPSPNPTIGSLSISEVEEAQQVTQPSTANQFSSVPSTSPTPLINPAGTSDGDYKFDYSVNNPETGDVKSHGEKRLNGVVTGYYMLLEADGTLRKVNYTADAENGFRATVSKLPGLINK